MFEDLKIALIKKHHNQNDLARVLEVSKTGISNRMNGITPWSEKDIDKIAKYYKVPKHIMRQK